MGDLTRNFSLSEYFKSETAEENGIDNSTDDRGILESIKLLAQNVSQPLRDIFGKIDIDSGYRNPILNHKVGGSKSSQHMKGEAGDHVFYNKKCRQVTGKKLESIFAQIVSETNIEYDQIILYPTFIHASYTTRRINRNEARVKKNGKYPIWCG